MLARYTIHRGKRPIGEPLPAGIRQDIRAHTSHCLRAPKEAVREYLRDPGDAAWKTFAATYRKTVAERFKSDRTPFDTLASLAKEQDVHIGCSCPTRKNPRVERCHTVLALRFMQSRYPGIEIVFPAETRGSTR